MVSWFRTLSLVDVEMYPSDGSEYGTVGVTVSGTGLLLMCFDSCHS